jgi:hypothetical protein
MNPSLILFRLQQTDSQIDKIIARLQEINRILSNDQELRNAINAQEQAQRNVELVEQKLHDAEHLVRDQQIKIQQVEASLYGGKIRNPKELQDMQHESAALKRYLKVLEDRQLDFMIELEQAELERDLTEQTLRQLQSNQEITNSQLIAQQSQSNTELNRLQTERQMLLPEIPPETLDLYERLRVQRRGIAVVQISDQACTACGAVLTPALVQSAQSLNQIVRCPSCGRILYPR